MISIENSYELSCLKLRTSNGLVRSPGSRILTALQDFRGFQEVEELDKKLTMLIIIKLDRRCYCGSRERDQQRICRFATLAKIGGRKELGKIYNQCSVCSTTTLQVIINTQNFPGELEQSVPSLWLSENQIVTKISEH
jgi:hypothetical protein